MIMMMERGWVGKNVFSLQLIHLHQSFTINSKKNVIIIINPTQRKRNIFDYSIYHLYYRHHLLLILIIIFITTVYRFYLVHLILHVDRCIEYQKINKSPTLLKENNMHQFLKWKRKEYHPIIRKEKENWILVTESWRNFRNKKFESSKGKKFWSFYTNRINLFPSIRTTRKSM